MTTPGFYADRRRAVQLGLEARGLDALVVTSGPNLTYLTGFSGSAGAGIVTASTDAGQMDLLVDSRYITVARTLAASSSIDLAVSLVEGSYDEAIALALAQTASRRIGVEAPHLTVQRWQWLTSALENTERTLVPVDGIVEAGRRVKDAVEIERFRAAGRLLDRVVGEAVPFVREGRAEREVAADIEHALVSGGFEDRAFATIVASGPHSALPHARPTDRRLTEGDLVLLDFGGVHGGYCVDISRTLCVGAPTDDGKRLHAAVLDAQRAAIRAVRPGIPAWRVDEVARETLGRHGLADAFGHATGHGLGLEVHEAPRLGRRGETGSETALEAGMVITVEPGAYLPTVGGVRIEDDILVTPDGAELLTDAPRELRQFAG